MEDAIAVCGHGFYNVQSVSGKMIVTLKSGTPFVGRFKCTMKAVEDPCRCGQKNQGKIVGGMPTAPNEFPMMAGLIDIILGQIYCGATISTFLI
jgi:hypothetical protein